MKPTRELKATSMEEQVYEIDGCDLGSDDEAVVSEYMNGVRDKQPQLAEFNGDR